VNTRIREIPATDRPREKLMARGADCLTDAELIAIFLRTGVKGKSAIEVGAELLRACGSLTNLARCTPPEIAGKARGIGLAKAVQLAAGFELGRRFARGGDLRPKLETPAEVFQVFGQDFAALRTESLRVALLDTKLRLIHSEEIALGSINECVAHPREIFRPALVHSAYAVVVMHNHPSGDVTPSEPDRLLTKELAKAAQVLQIKLVDHLIIGTADGGRMPYFSFSEHGWL
jgi:DNA repair protein RadC